MLNNKIETLNPLLSMQQIVPQTIPKTLQQELLMTSVPPPDANCHLYSISNAIEAKIPLRTRNIDWPKATNALCLHCAGPCTRGPPLPIVKYYDPQQQQFWIYGPFCTPSCCYASICSSDNSNSTKQMTFTHCILRDYFGFTEVTIGPPRAAHCRFGGPLQDSEFYAYENSKYRVTDILEPPFVTFAHYVLAVHQEKNQAVQNTYDVLPQSAGRLTNLSRPTERKIPVAKKVQTGHVPLILDYLATVGTNTEDRTGTQQTENAPKKRSRMETEEITIRGTPPVAPKGFLARYVTK